MQTEPITQEGYDLLTKEFKYLKEIEKPKVSREKEIAAALGDRARMRTIMQPKRSCAISTNASFILMVSFKRHRSSTLPS